MKVIKILTLDGKEFFCRTKEELETFIENYRASEGERLMLEFPTALFLVDHVEEVEMSEEEYQEIPTTSEGIKYFGSSDLSKNCQEQS